MSVEPGSTREETLTERTRDAPHARDATFGLLVSCASGASLRALPDTAVIVLGRGADATVRVEDPSVSRRHALLRLAGELTVEDCGSTNGTRVNGLRLVAGARARLEPGAVLELGSAVTVLQRARPSATPTAMDPVGSGARDPADGLVVEDAAMRRLHALVGIVAASPVSVVLLGETGVGKEVFAAAIHRRSPRAAMPFLSLNCAALPDSVLEGELFGYEKGAFTGAAQGRAGFFEAASGGTLFLDELGEMPLATQPKLLRVLESGEVLRIGARRPVRTDVRIVAATNRDLRAMVAGGQLRADLFFRLNGMTLTIPPLRHRAADVPFLARRFLASACARLGKPAPRIARAAEAALVAFDWPGNVRELRNVMERVATLCAGPHIGEEELCDAAPELLPHGPRATPPPSSGVALTDQGATWSAPSCPVARDDARAVIVSALTVSNGNQKRAAELLGISRRTLLNRLDAHGIGRPRKRS